MSRDYEGCHLARGGVQDDCGFRLEASTPSLIGLSSLELDEYPTRLIPALCPYNSARILLARVQLAYLSQYSVAAHAGVAQ